MDSSTPEPKSNHAQEISEIQDEENDIEQDQMNEPKETVLLLPAVDSGSSRFPDPEHTVPLIDAIDPNSPKPQFYPQLPQKDLTFEKGSNRWDSESEEDLPKIGDIIGNYQIESELGRGGFGAVYQAKNLALGRTEALKLILPSTKSECLDYDKRFEREIDIISRLEHPNIVRLYNSGTIDHGIRWMSMELITGERLDNKLKSGALPFELAKSIMLQLLSGLQEAHRRQIIHRDLKPSNIMITQKEGYANQVVILDFGLSKALGVTEDANVQHLTIAYAKCVYGTPKYMAPEQLTRGIPIGPWTDVYSAGLIFLELLTGKAAFCGQNPYDIASKQTSVDVELPPTLQHTALEAVIKKACAKTIADRYQNAGEFLKAIMCIAHSSDPASVLNQPAQPNPVMPSDDNNHPPRPLHQVARPTRIVNRPSPVTKIIHVVTYILALILIALGILVAIGLVQISW